VAARVFPRPDDSDGGGDPPGTGTPDEHERVRLPNSLCCDESPGSFSLTTSSATLISSGAQRGQPCRDTGDQAGECQARHPDG
jgi:hypothetical protein